MGNKKNDTGESEKDFDKVLSKFQAYAEYVGKSSVYDFYSLSDLNLHSCKSCDVDIPVVASDQQAYGPVLCPICGEICESVNLGRMKRVQEEVEK